jgi:hypothetical protein
VGGPGPRADPSLMSTVYTVAIQAIQGLNGTITVGPPPTGFKWVLKDGDFYFNGTLGGSVRLVGAGGQAFWVNNWAVGTPAQYASWRGRNVIGTGKTFQIISTAATDCTISGFQLQLP